MRIHFFIIIISLPANNEFSFILHAVIRLPFVLGQFDVFNADLFLWQLHQGLSIYHLGLHTPQCDGTHQELDSSETTGTEHFTHMDHIDLHIFLLYKHPEFG